MEDTCRCTILHQDRIDRAARGLPDPGSLAGAAGVFRLLGDPGRLRLVLALGLEELCVCDLAALAGATSSAVSHQLRLLKQAGLLTSRREGKVVYYRLARPDLVALAGSLGAVGAAWEVGA